MDIANIDDGSALAKAKSGDLAPILNRLRERRYLNDESLTWIADRLEGKKEGRQKTGGKQNKHEQYENFEMYAMFRWLVDIEQFKPKEARHFLKKRYSGKDDTIRKILRKFKDKKISHVRCIAAGIDGNSKKFLATKNNKYRPIPLQKIGIDLSIK